MVIREYGGPEVLELREVPDPKCGPEDLLVAIRATALNRADILQRMGFYPQPGPKPEFDIPGLEFAGEVIELGPRVEGFSRGNRVMGILAGGSYGEKISVHHRLVTTVPEGTDWREAAAVPEAFLTAHDALMQCRLEAGESVLIHAVGSGVGVAALQVARVMGATPIIGTAGSEQKLDAACELGLDVAVAYKQSDFAEATLAATQGCGVDVVVDFVGAAHLAGNLRALALKGRLIVIGLLGGSRAELDLGVLLAKRLQLRGAMLRSRSLEEKAMATRAFEKSVLPHLAAGRIRPVIDRVFPLTEVAEAHRYMETNANFGKIVLDVDL
ncbi:MAG: NAD(P)H-quinone oxidoreductase [Candidatus Binatia bacterium]